MLEKTRSSLMLSREGEIAEIGPQPRELEVKKKKEKLQQATRILRL